jgi:hypothetical protein
LQSHFENKILFIFGSRKLALTTQKNYVERCRSYLFRGTCKSRFKFPEGNEVNQ